MAKQRRQPQWVKSLNNREADFILARGDLFKAPTADEVRLMETQTSSLALDGWVEPADATGPGLKPG